MTIACTKALSIDWMLEQIFFIFRQVCIPRSVDCTCEVDGADGVDMIMDVGWVRPALSAVLPGKFRARALHPDAQAISADHS